MRTNVRLTDCQQALYDALFGRGDVSFLELYRIAGGPPERENHIDGKRRHYAQSWLSSYIRRLNHALEADGLRVARGEKRLTYRLIRR